MKMDNMKMNVKKCLFGGALIGAGICSSAVAGDVVWDYAENYLNVYTFTGIDYGSSSASSGNWNTSASTSNGDYAHTIGGTFGLDMAALSTPNFGSYAYADTYGYFTVTSDTTFLLSWDADRASIVLVDTASGSPLLQVFGVDVPSSFEYTFLTGITYYLDVYIQSTGNGNLSTFSMSETTVNVVPLPPAAFAGLGMLAGLGAYRRIRK